MNIPKNCSTSYSTYLTRLICIICVQTIRGVFRVKRCFYLSDVTVEASVLCAVESHTSDVVKQEAKISQDFCASSMNLTMKTSVEPQVAIAVTTPLILLI
jgi:hypothetical protein